MASGSGNDAGSNSDAPLQLPWSPEVQGPLPAAVEAVVGFGFPLALVTRVYFHLLSVRTPPPSPHTHRGGADGSGGETAGNGLPDLNGVTLTAATLLTAVDDALRHSEYASFANDGMEDGAHWAGMVASFDRERGGGGGGLTDTGGKAAALWESPTSGRRLQGDGSRGGGDDMAGGPGETNSGPADHCHAGDPTSGMDGASGADALRDSAANSIDTASARDVERGADTEQDIFTGRRSTDTGTGSGSGTARSSDTGRGMDTPSDGNTARLGETARGTDSASAEPGDCPVPSVCSSQTSSHHGASLSTQTAPASSPITGLPSTATPAVSTTATSTANSATAASPSTTANAPAATVVAASSLASSTTNTTTATLPGPAPSSQTTTQRAETKDRDSENTDQRARERMRQLQKLWALRAENKRLKARSLCQHCRERPVSLTLLPCGHFCFCQECGATFNACPVCRKTILADVKTFVS